jgi:hypothetical protein
VRGAIPRRITDNHRDGNRPAEQARHDKRSNHRPYQINHELYDHPLTLEKFAGLASFQRDRPFVSCTAIKNCVELRYTFRVYNISDLLAAPRPPNRYIIGSV